MVQNNEMIRKIANKLSPKFKIIELTLIPIIAILVLLKLLSINTLNPGLIISMSLLSSLYFFMSFATDERIKENLFAIFINKISNWGLSILILGLLFTLMHFPSADMMLIIGTLTTLINLPIIVFTKGKDEKLNDFYRPIFVRSLLLGSIGLIALLYYFQLISF